ncbi:hypothetical protein [Massilia antarctica]|uniref:hypothetical protein n=1 Tax=Massilia antarctica TaxID=2765360 RepID=UPI0015E19A12|nr:hypothetical protein [Massilia sp. H27-R4]MCY0916081.1 hypothetical protein [Massilia sp. H27-R4]
MRFAVLNLLWDVFIVPKKRCIDGKYVEIAARFVGERPRWTQGAHAAKCRFRAIGASPYRCGIVVDAGSVPRSLAPRHSLSGGMI